MQQLYQQIDFRIALLAAARREVERLKQERDCPQRQALNEAAIEALKFAATRDEAWGKLLNIA
jgi:hypothetical protein